MYSIAPPAGWSGWIITVGGAYVSDAAWGTDIDHNGAAFAGADSMRLLSTLNRNALVSDQHPIIGAETYFLVVWVQADDVSGANFVRISMRWLTTTSPASSTVVDYYNNVLTAANTWQLFVFNVIPPFPANSLAQILVSKANTAFNVSVGYAALHEAPRVTVAGQPLATPGVTTSTVRTIIDGTGVIVPESYEIQFNDAVELETGAILEIT